MKAEEKLCEAGYFLEKLKSMSRTICAGSNFSEPRDLSVVEPEFRYILSAFMTSWRSVIDVLLYDYAEKYFKIDPKRGMKVTQDSFEIGAEILKNCGFLKATKFIKWYKGKMRKLRKEFPSLFDLRDTSFCFLVLSLRQRVVLPPLQC